MMQLQRQLSVVTQRQSFEPELVVAFATTDLGRVDQHFGSARKFARYGMNQSGHWLVDVGEFNLAAHDGNESKLAERISWLTGSDIVYCQAVGSSAVQQLILAGIQPVRVQPGTPVGGILEHLASELTTTVSPWLERILQKRQGPDPDRIHRWLDDDDEWRD